MMPLASPSTTSQPGGLRGVCRAWRPETVRVAMDDVGLIDEAVVLELDRITHVDAIIGPALCWEANAWVTGAMIGRHID